MDELKIDISLYQNTLSLQNKMIRFFRGIVWGIFVRTIPRSLLNGWKIFLLLIFGAKIHKKAVVYSSARIYMPCNLEMDEYSILGSEVDCYNVAKIKIGVHVVVSQKTFLCAA